MDRRELQFSVSGGSENVERQHYTKTWQVEASPLLHGDGGDVQKLSPIVRGTTAELEARHSQLDEILVGLLNEATANKGQEPASGSVTLTSQRVTRSQPQVKQYTETSTLLQTAQRQLDKSSRHARDDMVVDGPTHERSYVSDTEQPSTWLNDQRMKLRAGRRAGWRERDRQLVSELRSAQSWRLRAQSESEMAPSQPAEVRPGPRYVSGVERRPFTSQQTMYTFGVSAPQRTASVDLYDSPPVPERTDSSREAMARQRRSQGTCCSLYLLNDEVDPPQSPTPTPSHVSAERYFC